MSLLYLILFIKSYIIYAIGVQTPCADQIQRCGVLIEKFERQIQDIKALTFRRCFISQPCLQERLAFDDCYAKSIRAVRAHFNGDNVPNDSFFDTSDRYRVQLEQCFGTTTGTTPAMDHTTILIDEDSVYARGIFSTEFGDRLWDLVETKFTEPIMDPHAACMVKEYSSRIFGGGISRIIDTANPKLNNFNTSCTLNTNEITCYKSILAQDDRFQQLVKQRDRSLKSCIQSVRSRSICQYDDSSRFRMCLCNAREEFENRLQASLLDCTRRSEIGQLYALVLRYSQKEGVHDSDAKYQRTQTSEQKARLAQKYGQTGINLTVNHSLQILDPNQCTCTCPDSSKTYPNYALNSDHDGSSYYTPEAITPATHLTQDQTQGTYQGYQYPSNYYQNYYYQQQHPGIFSSSFDPTAAVADGFKRFWHGLPPVRRMMLVRKKRT